MGRKVKPEHLAAVLNTIKANDGQVRAHDVAKQLKMHPQAVARLLPAIGEEAGELLCEDDRGFLSIFKR